MRSSLKATPLALILSLLLPLSPQEAFTREARGATSRSGKAVRTWDFDIEDLIRAESDPEYFQYLQEKAQRNHVERNAVEEQARLRRQEAELAEQARREFLRQRDRQTPRNESQDLAAHEGDERKWNERQESARAFYKNVREKEHSKVKRIREANLQRAFEPQRFPAAVDEEPRYPHLKSPQETSQ